MIDTNITLVDLAEKYQNTCAICGRQVDWSDKSIDGKIVICGNIYPSIDHIKPISKGGLHSWDNVQLAHRICNIVKSNKLLD